MKRENMPLPIINTPSTNFILPVSKQKLRLTTFNMATQKNISLISEAGDSDDIIFAVKNIINGCVIEPKTFDSGKLNVTDMTAIFLKLVEISKGPELVLKYKCNNQIQDEESEESKPCNSPIEIIVDISKYEVEDNKEKNLIDIDESIGLSFHYLTLDDIERIQDLMHEYAEDPLAISIAVCIDDIYQDKKEIQHDWTIENLIVWINTFPLSIIMKLSDRINNAPKIKKEIELKCPKCGNSSKIVLSDLEDFFGFGAPVIR